MPFSLTLLGSLHLSLDGLFISHFRSDKERALLAFLALERERPQRRETLAGFFWGDQSQELAFNNLRKTLFRLRQTLGDEGRPEPLLLVTAKEVQWNPAAEGWLDVAVFNAHIASSRKHRHRHPSGCPLCCEQLEAAVALYQGHLLEGFSLADCPAFDEWVMMQREALRAQMLSALSHLIAHYETTGNATQAIAHAQRLVRLEPWQESAQRALMRLWAAGGQRVLALKQYETCRALLAAEVGIEPEAETTALYQAIKAGRPVAANAWPFTLPQPLTPFIGRTAELARLQDWLLNPDTRLLTLVGEGGIGKTRLALAAAEAVGAAFPDGVWFVPLAGVTAGTKAAETEERLALAVASALNLTLQQSPSLPAQLAQQLRPRDLLLVLDNFEQLVAQAAFITDLLTAAPRLVVLATSREPLNLQAEIVFRMGGLSLAAADPASSESGRLFVERAERAAGWQPTAADSPAIGQICDFLHGSPLGIELAATWVRFMPLPEIVAALHENLDFLTHEFRDAPLRHTSMRAVFAGSWGLLSQRQRAVLAAVSCFYGGFTAEGAEAVAGATLRDLAALTEKSLLQQDRDGRYDMHTLQRQFAREQLVAQGEAMAVQQRHRAFFARFAAQARQHLRAAGQQHWLERLDGESHNLRAALDAAEGGERLQLALDLTCFWRIRGYWHEGCGWLARCLDDAPEGALPMALRAEGMVSLAELAWCLGDYATAEARAAASIPLWAEAETQAGMGKALYQQAMVAYARSEYAAASALFARSSLIFRVASEPWELAQTLCQHGAAQLNLGLAGAETEALLRESQHLFQAAGDQWGLARTLNYLGSLAWRAGRLDETERLYSECLAIWREFNDRGGVAAVLNNLGELARYQGRLEEAQELYAEALVLQRELGTKAGVALLLHNLGHVAQAQGQLHESLRLFKESLALYLQQGSQLGVVMCLAGLAGTAAAIWHSQGQPPAEVAQIGLLFGATQRLLAETESQLDMADRLMFGKHQERLAAAVDGRLLAEAIASAKGLSLAELVAVAQAYQP